jgi:hypothetical protein
MQRTKWNWTIWVAAVASVVALCTGSALAATNPVSDWNAIAVQTLLAAGQG